MKTKAVSGIMLTLLLMSMLTLAFAQVPSATPYTDFHDLLYAGSSNLQTIIGFAYELFNQPGLWLSLGELNPDFVDPWYDNNNFVPASGRLLISVHDIKPLSEQILSVEFDTGSLPKIYVPSTDGTTYWLYLWVADDGSTYYDKEMSLLARAAPTAYKVLVDEGHSEWLVSGNAQTLIQALEDKGYIVETFSGMLTQSLLDTYSVLVIGTAWGSFAQSEIQAIEDFVKNGGGLWLMGLGWSWVDYHPGSTLEDYPMNKIAQRFGAFFNPDIIFDPTNYTNDPGSAIFHSPFIASHPVTQGVARIGAIGALHGSISIQTGTILVTGDDDSYGGYHESPYPNPGSHPPNCAAIEYGSGKVIVISQEGFFIDSHIDEYDNKMLGLNIVDWLATPVIPATINIDSDTLNLKSRGQWITAYIQLPEEYNAEDVDATTILLDGTISPVLDPKYEFVTNSSEYLVDHNEDGILERMVKFDRTGVMALLSVGEATLTITGEVIGTPFEGSDSVRVR